MGVLVGVLGVLATIYFGLLGAPITIVESSEDGGGSTTTAPVRRRAPNSSASLLSAQQLEATLVPEGSYKPLLPEWYDYLEEDLESYALQGGISSLTLCNASLPVPDLGPEVASSYVSVPIGVRPDIYFGSDAASLRGNGASRLLDEAARQAVTCGWRKLPGPRLDEGTVRLTGDLEGNEGTLHGDVILVRDRGTVVEIGVATVSGLHSTEAENLAKGAAERLRQAVRQANA